MLAVEDDVVDEYINLLISKVQNHREANPGQEYVMIHFGVNGGMDPNLLHLENTCYNSRCFKGKNEYIKGYLHPVAASEVLDHMYFTRFPLERLVRNLGKKHPSLTISYNPGRYLCNYI